MTNKASVFSNFNIEKIIKYYNIKINNKVDSLPLAVRRSRKVSRGERRSAEGKAAMP